MPGKHCKNNLWNFGKTIFANLQNFDMKTFCNIRDVQFFWNFINNLLHCITTSIHQTREKIPNLEPLWISVNFHTNPRYFYWKPSRLKNVFTFIHFSCQTTWNFKCCSPCRCAQDPWIRSIDKVYIDGPCSSITLCGAMQYSWALQFPNSNAFSTIGPRNFMITKMFNRSPYTDISNMVHLWIFYLYLWLEGRSSGKWKSSKRLSFIKSD